MDWQVNGSVISIGLMFSLINEQNDDSLKNDGIISVRLDTYYNHYLNTNQSHEWDLHVTSFHVRYQDSNRKIPILPCQLSKIIDTMIQIAMNQLGVSQYFFLPLAASCRNISPQSSLSSFLGALTYFFFSFGLYFYLSFSLSFLGFLGPFFFLLSSVPTSSDTLGTLAYFYLQTLFLVCLHLSFSFSKLVSVSKSAVYFLSVLTIAYWGAPLRSSESAFQSRCSFRSQTRGIWVAYCDGSERWSFEGSCSSLVLSLNIELVIRSTFSLSYCFQIYQALAGSKVMSTQFFTSLSTGTYLK